MLAYILDCRNLAVKDVLEFEEYDFKEDIEYCDKSSIVVSRKPNLEDEDFIFCKDGNDVVFIGICETFKSDSRTEEYTISIWQKECFFDREIFVEEEGLIAGTGIEDFIVRAIQSNFADSGDELMDKPYISVAAGTHTPVAAKVDAEQGVYNLKTYLGNAKQYYGIFVDFIFSEGSLIFNVYRKKEPIIPIDIEVSDISSYKETYSVSVLARLLVKWKLPDAEDENGNIVIGKESKRQFYLLSDRTITEEKENSERASGISKSVYIEAESEEEMLQEVYNEFSSNRYNHKITFALNRSSRLYPSERFYVGRECMIRTKTGVKTSLITKSEIKDSSIMTNLTFGTLKVSLIEKLRR